MFEKILIANRGGAAAQPNCPAAESREGDFAAETRNV
jgi:hypothetical protein